MKTKAAVLCGINKELQIEELEIPQLKPGQVLVKIAYSGVCHSQLNEIKGLKGEDKFLPHTLGHEGSGVVEAISTGVKKVKEGDRVVLTWIKGNGADTVAIFGIGGIGLSALLAAILKQASLIIAIDIFDNKLDSALQLGATHVINAKKQDILSEILRITDKQGVDYAIECAGIKESMDIAFSSVRDKGGTCIIVGNLPYKECISINPFDLIKGKNIIGTWGGETQPDRDIPIYVDLFLSGKFNLVKMIGQIYGLKDINRALYKLKEGCKGRILLEC